MANEFEFIEIFGCNDGYYWDMNCTFLYKGKRFSYLDVGGMSGIDACKAISFYDMSTRLCSEKLEWLKTDRYLNNYYDKDGYHGTLSNDYDYYQDINNYDTIDEFYHSCFEAINLEETFPIETLKEYAEQLLQSGEMEIILEQDYEEYEYNED